MRLEAHFGTRVVRCFAERPNDIDRAFRDAVARYGDSEALVLDERRLAYAELDEVVGRLAGNLALRFAVGEGDRVGVYSGNCLEVAFVVLACARLGAVSVPLGHRLQTPELAYMLGHSGAKVVMVEARLAPRLPARGTLPDLAHVFAWEGEAEGCERFETLLGDTPAPPPAAIDEEQVASILYTSGTTGRPKGAMLTHLNIVHTMLHYRVCMDLGPGDRTLMAVPVTHVTGLVAQLLAMVGCGGGTVMMREFKARAALELIEAERITHGVMVPTMYKLMLLDPEFDRFDLSSLRVGGFGGAPMPEATIEELARRAPGLALRNAYGATETTSPTTLLPLGKAATHKPTVGTPVPCADVIIVDEEGRELAVGETGEVWVAGAMVVPGYWRDPQANAREFTGGYWHSGDIGRMTDDGYLEILDRAKDMINRGGYKVFSAEVENVLAQHPDVVECAVVGSPDPVLGERVHAVVVGASGGFSADALKRFCSERLADYKVPETYTAIGALPRNANGKIIKAELRARAAETEEERKAG
jgi:acyl-CoA synthetase (AMP-forming)/AMP-acid ligase II